MNSIYKLEIFPENLRILVLLILPIIYVVQKSL